MTGAAAEEQGQVDGVLLSAQCAAPEAALETVVAAGQGRPGVGLALAVPSRA